MRHALRRLCQSAGMTVIAFASGDDFLSSLAARTPDCVVLDLHMPSVSGFEVQERLKRVAPGLPIIVLTGHDTPDSRYRVLAAGAAAYLRKPVDDKSLLDAIGRAISGGGAEG